MIRSCVVKFETFEDSRSGCRVVQTFSCFFMEVELQRVDTVSDSSEARGNV